MTTKKMNTPTPKIKHKLYSYTDLTDCMASAHAAVSLLKADPKARIDLRIKQGLTIKQEIDARAEQQDNASNTSDIVVIHRMAVEMEIEDVKLDDKVRDLQHQQEDFQEFKRLGHTSKKHEWSLVNIKKILKKLDLTDKFLYGSEKDMLDILHDPEFLKELYEKIEESKQKALKILNKHGTMDVVLRPWQEHVFRKLIFAKKVFNLLSLAPRFGKTFTVLEIAKYYQYQGEKVVLVPASKSLSSNESFINDYNQGGYTFKIIEDASLFVDNIKIIETLKNQIEDDEVLILVTDEADVASHTDISVEKLDEIQKNFNILKVIAMTGTAIYKASKIFLGVPTEDIFEMNITYTDLFAFDGIGSDELVERNFLNVHYPLELMPDGLIVKQSFEQASAYPTIAKYLNMFVNDKARDISLFGLHKSDVVMCFVPGLQKKYSKAFAEEFKETFDETVRIEVINGDETTNRKAEKKVKKIISDMKKNGDKRKLLLLSSGMSQRSFSVPEIRRVIIMHDGDITPSFLQMAARCLTYNRVLKGKDQIGDIIRISTTEINLMAELFMQEQPEKTHGEKDAYNYGKQFLMNNAFSSYTFTVNDENSVEKLNLGSQEELEKGIAILLDAATKIQDTVKYLVGRFWDTNLNYSEVEYEKTSKASKKNVSDTAKNKPKGKKKNMTPAEKKEAAEKERRLERYMALTRCVPYIGAIDGIDFKSLDEALNSNWSEFETESGFFKVSFQDNLLDDDFKVHVESLFRAKEQLNTEELKIRNREIFNLIGA